jgi:pyridoxine 4-dehydrogenase
VHDLSPRRLRGAVEFTISDLGRPADVVFLHNPERSLRSLTDEDAFAALAEACMTLDQCARSGKCMAWGISTWDPRPVAAVIAGRGAAMPRPAVLMFRSGLLVGADVMKASEALSDEFGMLTWARWGMSPFGGDTTEPVWQKVDSRMFIADNDGYTREQAAFRVAAELPEVDQLAVGTNNPSHLRDLVAATELKPDWAALTAYRKLIGAPAPSAWAPLTS